MEMALGFKLDRPTLITSSYDRYVCHVNQKWDHEITCVWKFSVLCVSVELEIMPANNTAVVLKSVNVVGNL